MNQTKTIPIPPLYEEHRDIKIHIDIRSSGFQYEMMLKAETARQKSKIDLLPKDLEELNNRIRDVFRSVAFGNSQNREAIKNLAAIGYNAFLQIFDKNMRRLFQQLLSYYKSPIIEITTDTFFLPWELLYLSSTEEPVSLENFLGSRYIISRLVDLGNAPFIAPFIYQAIPRVGLLANNDLPYVSSREMPFFENLDRSKKITLLRLGVLDPNKKQKSMREFEIFLSNNLDIAHFACHAYSNKDHSLSSMVLSEEFEVSHSDLKELIDLQLPENPIVVLNACGTGNINSEHASFFAKDFLQLGARGVIATDCEIPDHFAAEFSARFYPEFINGTPIGKALLETRRYFLEKHHNLTALIYSMYASPIIMIANKQIIPSRGENYG